MYFTDYHTVNVSKTFASCILHGIEASTANLVYLPLQLVKASFRFRFSCPQVVSALTVTMSASCSICHAKTFFSGKLNEFHYYHTITST